MRKWIEPGSGTFRKLGVSKRYAPEQRTFRARRELKPERCGRPEGTQKPLEPAQEHTKVVAGSGEHGVDAGRRRGLEVIAALAVLGLDLANDRLDGGAVAHLDCPLSRCSRPKRRDGVWCRRGRAVSFIGGK